MSWREEYGRKLVSFEAAAALVQPGDTVFTPIGGDARSMMPALFARVVELDYRVRIRACSATPAQEWFNDEFAMLPFDLNLEVFAGPTGRQALAGRRADFFPNLFSNQFNVYDHRDGQEPIDVFLAACTPPDERGYVHFGGQPWHKGDFTRRARTAILEVCPWLPDVPTTEYVHVSEVAAFVETALPERPAVARRDAPPETAAVAAHVNEVLRDGDTVQIGAGRTATHLVPEGLFEGKRDLGWHSEITPPGVVAAMMEGVLNGSRKTVDPGLHITTTVNPQTPEEEEWLVHSGMLETRPVREVNAIPAVALQERMTSINNAFTVDLTGQICAESLGTVIYNGTGGQPEFHIGAFIAPNGQAITVLPSSALDGQASRIVPRVTDGAYVTVPRSFADYVVTEHGIAQLAGKSQRQRADELIAIAHPDHQGELRAAARTLFYPPAEAPPAATPSSNGATAHADATPVRENASIDER